MKFNYSEAKPEISIQAITSSVHPKTMRIVGRVKNQNLTLLIDSGSTHNFLISSVVKKTRLLLNRKCQIHVKVANGEEVLSECKCSEVQIQLKDMSFGVDTYVIILA
jgi:predicted aspartyl protease